MTSVAVVGSGVVGLSCALELAHEGHAVTVVAAEPSERSTSALAAAIWYPFEVAPEHRVLPWARVARERFEHLARYADSGVELRRGRILHRRDDPELDWVALVPEHRLRDAAPGDPDGVRLVSEVRLPVIDMSRYLPFLEARVADAGVPIVRARLTALGQARAWGEVVVNASGLGAAGLVPDGGMHPIRGQVVRLASPGLAEFTLDDDHPGGLTYVIPRTDDVVCGGTAEHGAELREPDPEVEAGLLARARELVPALAEAPISSRAVGLRPGRGKVRLDLERTPDGSVVHCYGHGGAGVTLSWGCAEEVAELVARA
ncbi:MAG: FAD-binding oxidoreductase [Actinomycetales bacterium]|nr:FAD-binding oxidoreductase [Actinomycetales bacterium]